MNTPIDTIQGLVKTCRDSFNSGKTRTLEWRKQQLQALINCISENKDKLAEAMLKDLKMNPLLRDSEIRSSIKDAELMLANIDQWMQPEKRNVPFLQFPGNGKIYKDPRGVVLIISPWNYPVSLIMRPFIGAIAAGNCVVLKPSEVSANTAAVIAEIIPNYVDNSCVKVVLGAVNETSELLKYQFDHIFYTGNGTVGKIIMKAAAEYLTPLTLELGGKSPCIVDKDVDLKKAVPRICLGKYMNAGQTCVAPDYALVHKDVYEPFLEEMVKTIKRFFGDNPQESPDFGKIINSRHTARVSDLMKGLEIYYGGQSNIPDQYISPTIVVNVPKDTKIMQEEIFGPILPVFSIESIDEAIHFVNEKPKPLALYVFTQNNSVAETVLNNTSSGGGCVNETIFHLLCEDLPFGGVGPSGMGSYHGKQSFEEFVHHKSILSKPLSNDPDIRYPPYTASKLKWLNFINGIKLPSKKSILASLLPVIAIVAYFFI